MATDASLSADVADFEPHQALFAGEAGLDDYRILIPALGSLLSPAGTALLEIGFDQADPVSKIAENCGYRVELKQDLAKKDRLIRLSR